MQTFCAHQSLAFLMSAGFVRQNGEARAACPSDRSFLRGARAGRQRAPPPRFLGRLVHRFADPRP